MVTDTDHYAAGRGDALWAWKSFLRGHNPILMDFGIIDVDLAAPALLDLEIVQRLRFDVQDGRLSGDDGDRLLWRLGRLPIERHDHVLLLPRIWQLRENVTAYDAAYVALAERLGATLLTADGRLSQAPGLLCPFRVVA